MRNIEDINQNKNIEKETTSVTEVINNNLYFYAEINTENILKFNKDILNLRNDLLYRSIVTNHTVTPIYLYIQSPGGDILSSFSAMDTIIKVKENIPVYTVVDGYVASGASLMSIVGTKRYIKPNSFILIHQLSGMAWGNYMQIKDDVSNFDKFMKTLKEVYKKHTKIPMKKIEEILKHDLWFSAEEAIEQGISDSIL